MMNSNTRKNIIFKICAAIVAIAMFSACSKSKPSSSSSSSSSQTSQSQTQNSGSSSQSGGSSSSISFTLSSTSESSSKSEVIPKETRTHDEIQKAILADMVKFKNNYNPDTVGYLYMPGTRINDVVVKGETNETYINLDKYKKQPNKNNFSYFADYRNTFGTKKDLSKNTVIYAHSINDNPTGDYFSQLKKLLDIDFAKENQFIYFSTPESGMLWQIFAVYYVKVDQATIDANPGANYIEPNPKAEHFNQILSTARKGSVHNYDVSVAANDKILTLSTCTYIFDKVFVYPNDYRLVVMAKLVDKDTKPAKVTPNTQVVYPGKIYS